MNHTHYAARMVAGVILSGGVALAGLGMASGTAYASPLDQLTIPLGQPQPDPPGVPVATNSQPESPGARVSAQPQPDPPGRPVSPITTRGIITVGH